MSNRKKENVIKRIEQSILRLSMTNETSKSKRLIFGLYDKLRNIK
jgi:hypothetical protein